MALTTWESFKQLVYERVKSDGASAVGLADRGLGSPFDKRVMRHFRAYCRHVHEFWVYNAALTLAASDQEINLYDSTKCAREVFAPMGVFLQNVKVARAPNREFMASVRQQSGLSAGVPAYWIENGESRIRFDIPVNSTVASALTNYVEGWAEHPTIATDETNISLHESQHEACAAYCAVALALPVAETSTIAKRLAQYDQAARVAMEHRRSRNLNDLTFQMIGGDL